MFGAANGSPSAPLSTATVVGVVLASLLLTAPFADCAISPGSRMIGHPIWQQFFDQHTNRPVLPPSAPDDDSDAYNSADNNDDGASFLLYNGSPDDDDRDGTPEFCQANTYRPANGSDNCSEFRACNNGRWTDSQCPNGLWFDPNHRDQVVCDLPESVCAADRNVCNCQREYPGISDPGAPDTAPPPAETNVTCANDNRFHYVASATDCGAYVVCFNAHTELQRCRAGLQFNPDTEQCDYPEIVNCQLIDPDCAQRGVSFLAHAERSDAFYFCVNGYKSLQLCPFYHEWDARTSACRPKDDGQLEMDYNESNGYY